jgi:hypothetical protein
MSTKSTQAQRDNLASAIEYAVLNGHRETAKLRVVLVGGDGISLESVPADKIDSLARDLFALPAKKPGEISQDEAQTAAFAKLHKNESVASFFVRASRLLFGKPLAPVRQKKAATLDSMQDGIWDHWRKSGK